MKLPIQCVLFACAVVFATAVFAQDGGRFDGIKDLKFKSEDLESLPTSVEYKGAKYEFEGGHFMMKMPRSKKTIEKLKKKYAKKGKAPFRLCCDVVKIFEKKGKTKKTRFYKAKCDIIVLDMENKKIVLKKKEKLAKLCPT